MPDDTFTPIDESLSLRDRFAMAALPGVIDAQTAAGLELQDPETIPFVAAACYRIADALLVVRAQSQGPHGKDP